MIHQASPPSSSHTPPLAASWGTGLLLTWGLLWPMGASLTPVVYAQTGAQEQADHPILTQAKHLLDAEQAEEAITLLRGFLATSPAPELLDDTYLLLGATLHATQQYGEALKSLHQLRAEFPASEVAARGKLLQARSHAAMGNLDLALPLLTSLRTLSKNDNIKREALYLSGNFYAQKNDALHAIQAWQDVMALGPDAQAEDARARIRTLLEDTSDRRALERIREAFPRSFPGDLAALRLINFYVERNEEHLAVRQIQPFLANFPAHPQATKTLELLARLQSKLKSHQLFVATVLPFSGELAPFATETLNGVQLAIELHRERGGVPSIGLIVKDFESDRASFSADFSGLLNNDHPLAVIGPLLSKHLPAMAELAGRAHTPLITPAATLPNLRRLGSYVFSTSLTYELQAKRIATYAMKEQGFRRFCILYPNTTYGRELARLFAQEVRQAKGEVIASASYKEGDPDVSAQLKHMKAEDLKRYGLAVPVDRSKQAGKQTKMDRKVLYAPGFDAVFIPSRATDAGLITAQLNFHDMKVPFLGANGWNSTDFARTTDSSIDGAVFVDGFFVDSPNPSVQNFVDRYKARFGASPTLFAMQGYDAAKLVIDAAKKGATSGEAVRDQFMTQPVLSPLTGPAAFGPDGTLNRPLFLLQIKRGKFLQIN